MTDSAPLVLTETQNEVGILYLNDQKTLNALSVRMCNAITSSLLALSSSDQVKVILICSKAKLFCAGANIKEFKETGFKSRLRSDFFLSFKYAMRQVTKPLIAVVNDGAFGGGFELALMCDMVFANKNAKFGFPEIKLGLMPGLDGTLIAKVVGRCFQKVRCVEDDSDRRANQR